MVVYRTVSSGELLSLINGFKIGNYNTIRGQNTFKYEKDKSYIHFFKYQEHALYYMKKRRCVIFSLFSLIHFLLCISLRLYYYIYHHLDNQYNLVVFFSYLDPFLILDQ